MTLAALDDYAEWIKLLGLPGFLVALALFSYFKGLWLSRSAHKEIVDLWRFRAESSERRELDWKNLAFSGTLIAEQATKRQQLTVEERLAELERGSERP